MRLDLQNNENLQQFFFIAVFTWVTCYLLVQGFGLYTDDWLFYVGDRSGQLMTMLTDWTSSQGRPLGELVRIGLYELAGPGDQLLNHYLVSFVLATILGWLSYELLSRKFPRKWALIIVLLWIATPTDTTRMWLTMSVMKFALIVNFLAIWLYLNGHRKTSYVVAVSTLLMYESTFFPFVLAPLFVHDLWCRANLRQTLLHVFICLLCFLAIAGLRHVLMDGQVVRDNLAREDFLTPMMHGIWLYGIHWFDLFATRMTTALGSLDWPVILISGLLFIPLFRSWKESGQAVVCREKVLEWTAFALGLFVVGLIFTGVGEQYPDLPRGTRATRIYLVASLGGGALVALLVFLAANALRSWFEPAKYLNAVVAFVLLTALVSSAVITQKDYVRVWSKQRAVLISIYQQLQDIQPADVVLFLPADGDDRNHQPGDPGADGQNARDRQTIAMEPWGQWMDNLDRVFYWSHQGRAVAAPRMLLLYHDGGSAIDLMKNLSVDQNGLVVLPDSAHLIYRPWRKRPRLEAGKLILFVETETGARRVDVQLGDNGVPINRVYRGLNPRSYLNRKIHPGYRERLFPEMQIF
jgi:hypothetical protein